ncbi:MAG: hypothetical protein FJ403_07420 [Verrucomicrobia bacterium]|nr:hypothetical protein [Verrucomicrobiota bacterium]
MRPKRTPKLWPVAAALLAVAATAVNAQQDVTQPGDPIIASSSNSPGSEGVANAIDGKPTKYLNFDTRTGGKPSGFVVTPSIGTTVVTGITMQSANDAVERDPKIVTLEGSNDSTVTAFGQGNWTLIARLDNIPAYTARFQTQSFNFDNAKPYKHYRWTVHETQTVNGCCFQIAEVELLGTLLPGDVTQPGDAVIASSSNSPGSEGVANAIDGKPTKYLNFDTRTGGKPSGFIVTPSVGVTRVIGLTMQSANDAVERDPKIITLEGSNDSAVTTFGAGNWELIKRIDDIPAYTARFQTQTFLFDNPKPYKHYRWTVLETQTVNGCCFQIAEVELLGSSLPPDITQPGDPVIASSSNSPGSEGVANAIDGKPTKYLNFDTRTNGKPSGFIVSPSIGRTVVTGITMQSANDAVERDPKIITLEGSNDATVSTFSAGNWEQIVKLDNIPAYTARFQTQTFVFDNLKPYRHYRWTVLETQTVNGCCFQIAEVELLGTGAPTDVTQPGDPIIASSSNSPGSEGVANAIDGKPTKYLNFDTRTNGKPSGFVVTPSIGSTTITGITLQSANDAVERDPKIVTIEGSNDAAVTTFAGGNWELITRLDNIPAYTARFQTQEFYFANKKAYKHYRVTVHETQTVNGCCFQIAEVELVAITSGADCNKARFLTQPVDTPVLEGAKATFTAVVNGPWPLQWYMNGQPIPGARQSSYTTDAITPANATNVYHAQIVGCEKSVQVKANIFKPSATKSIGISFRGGGANGAPTLMNSDDIAGIHQQAYWINGANAGSGSLPDANLDPPALLLESDNKESTMTVEWQASGSWGSGTGDGSATQRMLNGLLYANRGTPATITFGSVPAGTHTVIAYIVNIPLQFQEANFTITGQSSQTYYIRSMNADEYNAAPGFYRGSSTDAKNRTVASYVRFDNVRPNNGTITLTWETVAGDYDRGSALNAVQLILNAPPAGDPPAITSDPQPTVVASGGTTRLSVTATGNNLTYQWQKNGRNIPNGGNISGATTPTLTIAGVSEADAALYSVAVFNPGGSTISKNASLRISKFDINDQLIGYWKLDETAGSTAANAAAGGKAGQVNGTAAWAKGQVGNALTLDGASTYVFVDDYTKAKRQIAGSAWVNIRAGVASDVAIFRNAQGTLGVGVNARGASLAGQFEVGLVFDQDANVARLSGAIGAGPNVVRATAPNAFPLGSWQHVAFSGDGAQLRLYLNGVEVASTDYITTINPPDMKYISMGARLNLADTADPTSALGPDAASPNFLSGQLDDVVLWTRALTGDEVSKVYDAGKAGQAVTTVKVTPPVVVSQPKAGVTFAAGSVTITFEGGRLQSSAAVTGPWADVANATSPFKEAASGARKFYRVVP